MQQYAGERSVCGQSSFPIIANEVHVEWGVMWSDFLAFGRNPCRSVLNSLQSLQLALGDTPQATVAIVQSERDQRHRYCRLLFTRSDKVAVCQECVGGRSKSLNHISDVSQLSLRDYIIILSTCRPRSLTELSRDIFMTGRHEWCPRKPDFDWTLNHFEQLCCSYNYNCLSVCRFGEGNLWRTFAHCVVLLKLKSIHI